MSPVTWSSIKQKFRRRLERGRRRARHRRCLLLLNQGKPPRVDRGPFAGMAYLSDSHCGQVLPKLVGSYEEPLHAWIQEAVGRRYRRILNVGCAEGYYAVGLARACPETEVLAFDVEPRARKLCSRLAALNGVTNVHIHGLCDHQSFEQLAGESTLVFMDIEGAEKDLVDPALAPSLRQTDLIIELHDMFVPGTREALMSRLGESHDLDIVRDTDQRAHYPALERLPSELRPVATHERRPPNMEWLRATSKNAGGQG
ncbi:MAG: class I SAM-dependent methyltransferase [Planctomycetota bacterium]|jgi:predicted O-methyltransferase YrrM